MPLPAARSARRHHPERSFALARRVRLVSMLSSCCGAVVSVTSVVTTSGGAARCGRVGGAW